MSDEHSDFDAVSRETYILDRRTVDQRMDTIEAKQAQLQRGLDDNTAATARIETGMGQVIEFFNTFQYGFKALNTVAKFVAPITTILAAVVAFIAYIKGGGK